MAKKSIIRIIFLITSLPFIFLSIILRKISTGRFHKDLNHCLKTIDYFKDSVPSNFIEGLMIAEDHRNEIHFGIDPIGIARAMLIRLTRGEIQGASTIEQQFVRVVTGRYERTIFRKIREQLLAVSLSQVRTKSSIASAYLSIAYFGSNLVGLKGLLTRFGNNLSDVKTQQVLYFVAQLKYPKPEKPPLTWEFLINRRFAYLSKYLTNY